MRVCFVRHQFFAKNILYEIKCLDCLKSNPSASVLYIGESSRTAFCRSSEHLIGYQKGITSNPLHKHSIDQHQGSKNIKFEFKVVKQFFTALSRMVAESVHIARKSEVSSNILLNSKGEYNRCKLPRLTIDGGGGGEEGKNSFNSPALDAGYDKDIRESKVCHRTMKQEISSLEDKCALTQTGSQSETSANILSSCSIEQMSVKKRKRGSTWEMVNFIRLTIILCDCFRCHLLLYFDKKLKHVSINESLISWLFWFGSLATSPQPRYSCNGWWHLPLLHEDKPSTH